MKTYQTFHNNSEEWWVKNLEKNSKVLVMNHHGMIFYLMADGSFVINNMLSKFILIIKNIFHYINSKKLIVVEQIPHCFVE